MSTQRLVLSVFVVFAPCAVRGEEPPAKKEQIFKTFVEEFVLLTPGEGKFPASFQIGSSDGPETEKPPTKVTLKRPFAIARYEVTQELYETIAGKNPSKWKGPRHAVEMVSWDEAVEFCRKVTTELQNRKLIGIDELIRLPSEAEWEYACRAGTTTRYSFGDAAEDLGDYGWFKGNARGNDPPVGKKKANPWGLYDMHGYVWEWCADAWQPTLGKIPTDGAPAAVKDVKDRVLRGGAWTDEADKARSAFRHHQSAETRSDAIGFRCVRGRK